VYRRSLLFGYSLQQGTERYSLEMAVCTNHNHSPQPESLAQYLHRALAPQWFKRQRADEQEVGKEASLNPAGNTLVEMRPRTRAAGFLTPQAAATAERHADALFGDVEAMTSVARSLLSSARSPEEAHVRMMLAAKAGQVTLSHSQASITSAWFDLWFRCLWVLWHAWQPVLIFHSDDVASGQFVSSSVTPNTCWCLKIQ
jgi:hypothetical protein